MSKIKLLILLSSSEHGCYYAIFEQGRIRLPLLLQLWHFQREAWPGTAPLLGETGVHAVGGTGFGLGSFTHSSRLGCTGAGSNLSSNP